MKKIAAVLFFCLLLMGCDNNPDTEGTVNHAQGKVIILQAYGSSGTAEGASHSFVELYNISDEAISLDGIGLYYADGTNVGSGQTNTATEDGEWKRISLDGKTIPAKGSFLILGPKESTSARYQIEEDYGDINDGNFTLSNRAFKVALIQSTANLTVQNPFTGNGGKPIAGYIDMVGAANDYEGRDLIFGFEEAPARNSASEAVRRADLTDTDNNKGGCLFPLGSEESVDYDGDFVSVRYAAANSTTNRSITNEELEVLKPRNSSEGAWDPFEDPAEPEPPENPTVAGTPSPLARQLLILQVGAATDGAITRSFVELYNNSDSPVNLNTYSIQYANAADTSWTVINLTGTIPVHGSYLVRGDEKTITGDSRLYIEDADQTINGFDLSNRNFKVALMANQNKLTVVNPFDMTGGKAAGYVDMIGARNGNSDSIDGYETALAQVISKQAAARRSSLTDTDDNSADFVRIDYRTSGINDEMLELRKPRTSSAGNWDPFAEPEPPIITPTENTLLILQIGAATDGNVSHSFVELYNNGDQAVNLSGYSLQYAEGTRETEAANRPNTNTEDGPWAKIDLSGTIQPKHSFLILGKKGTNANPALSITDNYGDINNGDFEVSNRSFKVVLLSNTTLLTMQNPFDTNGAGTKANGYIDMVGAMNTVGEDKINGYEGNPITDLNKQTGQRRKTLTDTDDNAYDFERAVYSGAASDEVELRRPKNLAHGAWDPITGE